MKKYCFVFLVAACGSSDPLVNECATKSASYLQSYVTTSGNCGDLPDQVVNISADGKIPSASGVVCEATEGDGCTQRNSGCKSTTNGVTCTATSSLTFSADGSKASGTFSVNCTGAASCAGSYAIGSVRL